MTHLKKLVSALLVLAMLLSAFAFAESNMEDLGGGYYRFTEPVTITVGKAQSPANGCAGFRGKQPRDAHAAGEVQYRR